MRCRSMSLMAREISRSQRRVDTVGGLFNMKAAPRLIELAGLRSAALLLRATVLGLYT
jgi:hypothetical protein